MHLAKQLTYVYTCYLQSDTSKEVCGQNKGHVQRFLTVTQMSHVFMDKGLQTRRPLASHQQLELSISPAFPRLSSLSSGCASPPSSLH